MTKNQDVPFDLFLNKVPASKIQKIIHELSDDNGSWWDRNISSRMTEFEQWIGSQTSPSKIAVRQHVAKMNYQSILDCGCGLCSEYHGYKLDKFDISYTGLDQCKALVEKSLSEGISAVQGSIEEIPLQENSFHVSYARHVLEHLMGYEKALSEMIRVASKEVIVVFFIPPTNTVPPSSDCLKYDVVEGIWHNTYQKMRMEAFLESNPKVKKFTWTALAEINESILHVELNTESEYGRFNNRNYVQ